MENTLENKARFFAQYFGQKVLKIIDNETPFLVSGDGSRKRLLLAYLELTPLSQISDEDRHEVSGDLAMSINEYGCEYSFEGLVEWGIYDADYLRSKGYALPYMGLSVEDLVNRGWVKLKED